MAPKLSIITAVLVFIAVKASSSVIPSEEVDEILIPTGNEFLYLGHRNGKEFVESDYYVSVNPAAWSNAEQDCEGLWPGGSLIMIETEEEQTALNKMLERFGSGKLYWTGGLYAGEWLWSSTGELIPEFAIPESDTTPTDQDRLILNHRNRFNSKFEILQDSQPQRYICEVMRNATADFEYYFL